jgi:primosomal protein N' (replication factor Y)
VKEGHLVVVPFGEQKVQGVVLKRISHPEVPETRPVIALVDEQVVVNPAQLALAREIAKSTLAPLADCVGLMLPRGLSQQADTLFDLAVLEGETPVGLTDLQTRLVALLRKRGPLRGRQIDRALPRVKWRYSARALVKKEILTSRPVLPTPTVRPKLIRTVRLATSPGEVLDRMESLPNSWRSARQRRKEVLRFLLREPGPVDVTWVYAETGGNFTDLRRLAERGLVSLSEQEAWRDPLAGLAYDPSKPLDLTSDQYTAWKQILRGLDAVTGGKIIPPFLLHGVTGSGKTEVYLRAVAETLARGRQSLVLVPEIALTAQTVRRFLARFPGQVGLLHSRLSVGERYDTWRRARAGQLQVIVGPRSALFSPLPDIGLIVVDEAHDGSYYQSTHLPYYHARTAAVAYARLVGAVCILGSATPDVTSYFQAKREFWKLLELPARILAHQETVRKHTRKLGVVSRYRPVSGQAEMMDLPPVRVVDMRSELKSGNRSIFSRSLQGALEEVLGADQQAILFLNRRGTATYVFCRDCGYTLRCPRCDTPLTYHGVRDALTCHHCGYQRKMPRRCPQCKGERIRQYGMGTERVEEEVQELFPEVRTLRWDWETTRQKGAHDMILSHFSNRHADVLVGTQMLAKGLDLPMVTLVGVVLADVGLHLPDYRSGERVFQVLSQVSGRAGRSPLGGQVILQTFHPGHYVIQAAANHDYRGFYQQELAYRRKLGYPPFVQLVRLEYRHSQESKAEEEARRMGNQVRNWLREEDRRATEMIGPVPCFYTRLEGQYRWHIVLQGTDPASMFKNRKMGDWRVEVNPQALL